MYQVTIIWEGAEIGYGEGESLNYARSEARASVSDFYKVARSEWQFSVKRS
jgi:hypothetical protein